jgi:hypothetical protein
MIFGKFTKYNYNFDGVTLRVVDLSSDYDLSSFENNIYGKKIDENFLLDKLSNELYSDIKYYFAPLYTSEILNPFEEFPPPTKKIEDELKEFTAIIGNFVGASFSPGDIIAASTGGYSAGFDITNNFAYVVAIDEEVNKLKTLMIGSVGTGTKLVFRKVSNNWSELDYTCSITLVQSYSDSPVGFINDNNIFTKNISTAGYLDGEPDNNYVIINEKENMIGTKNIINVAQDSVIKLIEDNVNGSS